MKSLVAFSGGLDSLYVLWKELTQTENDVTIVYYGGETITYEMREKFNVINLDDKKNSDIRWIQIQEIAKTIMEKSRSFSVMREDIDPVLLSEEDVCQNHGAVFRTAMAVRRINSGEFDRFIAGTCRDNDGFQINRHGFVKNETASSLMTAYFIKHAVRGELCLPLCETKYTAANALSELPDWLIGLNRSCSGSFLMKVRSCGNCYKCLVHSYARHLLDEGKTPDEIYDICGERSIREDGSWKSQKIWLCEEIFNFDKTEEKNFPMPVWGHSYKVPE